MSADADFFIIFSPNPQFRVCINRQLLVFLSKFLNFPPFLPFLLFHFIFHSFHSIPSSFLFQLHLYFIFLYSFYFNSSSILFSLYPYPVIFGLSEHFLNLNILFSFATSFNLYQFSYSFRVCEHLSLVCFHSGFGVFSSLLLSFKYFIGFGHISRQVPDQMILMVNYIPFN